LNRLGSGERFASRESDFQFDGNRLQDREIHLTEARGSARTERAGASESKRAMQTGMKRPGIRQDSRGIHIPFSAKNRPRNTLIYNAIRVNPAHSGSKNKTPFTPPPFAPFAPVKFPRICVHLRSSAVKVSVAARVPSANSDQFRLISTLKNIFFFGPAPASLSPFASVARSQSTFTCRAGLSAKALATAEAQRRRVLDFRHRLQTKAIPNCRNPTSMKNEPILSRRPVRHSFSDGGSPGEGGFALPTPSPKESPNSESDSPAPPEFWNLEFGIWNFPGASVLHSFSEGGWILDAWSFSGHFLTASRSLLHSLNQ
jgi:hypothetical protein